MPQPATPPSESRLPNRLALLLACATFPLIWVGGLVTTTDAGMAVPDWPSTYGYNLFLYPWQTWFFGPWDLFIEHGHRLLGATVGLLTIALVIGLWARDTRAWTVRIGFIALALVVFQGLLGGMRVLLDERLLAMIHGCTGPMFFALTVCIVAFTSRSWNNAVESASHPQGKNFRILASLSFLLATLMLGLGAVLRHIPVNADPGLFATVVRFHLLLACVLVLHALLLAGLAVWSFRQQAVLRNLALVLATLVCLQVVLGSCTWAVKFGTPNWAIFSWLEELTIQSGSMLQTHVVTAHVATGSLILAISAALSLLSFRLIQVPRQQVTHPKLFMELAL